MMPVMAEKDILLLSLPNTVPWWPHLCDVQGWTNAAEARTLRSCGCPGMDEYSRSMDLDTPLWGARRSSKIVQGVCQKTWIRSLYK